MRSLRRSLSKGHRAPSGGGGVGTMSEGGPPPPGESRSRRRYDPAWDDWKHPRRWPGVLLTCVIVLAFVGVVVWHYRPHAGHTSNGGSALAAYAGFHPPSPAFVPGQDGPKSDTTTYHGTHSKAAIKFGTDGNLLILHARCKCAYSFVVTIANTGGIPIAFPVSATGTYDTTVNETLPRGTYALTVIAQGPWSVKLIHPSPAMPLLQAAPKPFKYYSANNSVLGPFSSADRHLFLKFFSETNGSIWVYVLDPQGHRIDTAYANRLPLYQATATLPDPPNRYFIEVDALGLWDLHVQRTVSG